MSNAKARYRRRYRRWPYGGRRRRDVVRWRALYCAVQLPDGFGVCLRCRARLPLHELTNAFACSYLCLPCADRVEAEIEAL